MNELQRQQAIEYMKRLNMDPKYINEFAEEGKVYVFGGIALEATGVFLEWIKEIERDRDCLVYAVTHENFIFGECFSFLIVSKYEEDWRLSVYGEGDKHAALAYVKNITDEWKSESGCVVIQSREGKIRRIE